MRLNLYLSEIKLILTFIFLAHEFRVIYGKILMMRPLASSEVYDMLERSGRMDAIPEGRIVTQGLAAMAGFALGLTKVLGGVFLYDIITANVTAEMLNEGNVNSHPATISTQEICFNSRNARSLEEAQAVAEFYSASEKNKQATIRKSSVKRRRYRPLHKRLVKNKFKNANADGSKASDTAILNTDIITTGPGTSISEAIQPTSGVENTNTAVGTNSANNAGTGTLSTTTTQTQPENAINCIVIEKQ